MEPASGLRRRRELTMAYWILLFLKSLALAGWSAFCLNSCYKGRLTFRRCEHCNSEKCAWKLRRQPTFKEMEKLLGPTPVEIEVVPSAVKFLTPKFGQP